VAASSQRAAKYYKTNYLSSGIPFFKAREPDVKPNAKHVLPDVPLQAPHGVDRLAVFL
jgi:hypothetical protein